MERRDLAIRERIFLSHRAYNYPIFFFPPFLLFFTLVIAEEIKPAFSSSSFLSLKGNALRKRPVSRRLSRGKICDRLTRRKQELIRRIRGEKLREEVDKEGGDKLHWSKLPPNPS